jgi:hypothetical protein
MIINPGSHEKQGPWDPDAKRQWIDTRYLWTLMPLLLLMLATIALVSLLGD